MTVVGVLSAQYLLWGPRSPDLFAQLARTGLVQRAGMVNWWTGWFGGLALPSYSVIAPPVMAAVGVGAAGVAAVAVSVAAGAILVRDAPRPTAAAVGYALTTTADLAVGRITFGVGLALATWALVAVRARWWWWAGVLALAAFLASPLAGLFVGLLLVAVALTDRTRRGPSAILAATLLTAGGAMQLWFPGAGTMPITVTDVIPAALACFVLAASCPPRTLRVTALLVLAAMPIVLVFPGAVGSNITRLAWLCAVPALLGYARLERRALTAMTAVLAAWPVTDTVQQLSTSTDRSTQAGFYQPLAAAIRAQQAPGSTGERVEVVDTASHGASAFLSPTVALARGWDRQADRRYNPLFYAAGSLDASTYEAWLTELAVGWVAVPHAITLDYAATAENRLVADGLPYLKPVWETRDWTLYRVVGAAPLALGATVESVGDTTVQLATPSAANVAVQIRWSLYLVVLDTDTQQVDPHACVRDDHNFVRAYLPGPGAYTLTSRFDANARWHAPHPCPATALT